MFKPIQICRNYLSDWVLLIIHGNYWLKDSLLRFRIWSHLQLAGGGCFWNWRKKKGTVAAGLSSRRPPRRWMKSQIVFNQNTRPTWQTTHSNSEGPGARAMHFKRTPSRLPVSNKWGLPLSPSRFSEDITNVNDLRLPREEEAGSRVW